MDTNFNFQQLGDTGDPNQLDLFGMSNMAFGGAEMSTNPDHTSTSTASAAMPLAQPAGIFPQPAPSQCPQQWPVDRFAADRVPPCMPAANVAPPTSLLDSVNMALTQIGWLNKELHRVNMENQELREANRGLTL